MTRRELIKKLEGVGCHVNELRKHQELISARDSHLFDELKYIAYAKPPTDRSARVTTTEDIVYNLRNDT